MGVEGLALASSLSLMIYVLLQIIILKHSIGNHFYQGILIFLSKNIIAISISLYVMWEYKKYHYFNNLYLDFCLGSILGIICFLVLLLFLKTKEICKLKNSVYKKVK